MKSVIWVVILFALAVVLALASGIYTGNVYVVVEQTMIRMNLHAFILGLIAAVVVLYILIKFLAGVLNIPSRLQRFGVARKSNQAVHALNRAGLAFFEGRFEKAELEAAKVLANKEAGDNRELALMVGAHAADQMDNLELRNRYLKDIELLPKKQQLSRYLLLAESALGRRDYPTAEENLNSAAQINPNLTRLVRLQLRYAFDRGNALEVLDKADKLMKAGAINEYETEQYQMWAYRQLLALVSDPNGLKACLKRIPEHLKNNDLCVEIAEKYQRLGLYGQAVKWVSQHYPSNQKAELLEAYVESARFLSNREQQKVIDTADSWLKQHPKDAQLLMYLGQLAFGEKLWGKAQGYLEASIAIESTTAARLALARVFDETGQTQKAEAQRKFVLDHLAEGETVPVLLENP